MMTLLALVLTTLSLAQPAGSARDIAEQALRIEIGRDRLALPPDQLAQQFRDACSGGYRLACQRNTWLENDKPAPRTIRSAFEPSCDAHDALACTAWAWAMMELGDAHDQSADDREFIYRTMLKRQRDQCDVRGDAAACFDVGALLYDNKGITIDAPVKGASVYWDKGCDGGEYAACTHIARLMLDGKPVEPKRRSAYDYVKPACDAGYWDACYLLARLNQEKWSIGKRDEVYGDLCNKGHVDSCYSLGRSYFSGELPEPSPGRAQELFVKACGLMHARSCFEAGRGSGMDIMQSEGFLRKACDLGDIAGCKGLVDALLEWGQAEVVKDNLNAFEKVCEQRQSLKACEWLAYYYLDPDAPQRDFSRGRELLEEVCVSEDSPSRACFELGVCFEEKIGGSRDRTDAVKYYRWACQNRYVQACYRAGQLLAQDEGVRQDDAEALAFFGQACDGEMADACTRAGELLRRSVQITRSAKLAVDWFGKGCDQNNAASCLGLGEVLEVGIDPVGFVNGQSDPAAARVAYQRAINQGSAEAKARLARLLWNALGGKKSKKRARQLVRDSCQEGFDDACEGVQKLTPPS